MKTKEESRKEGNNSFKDCPICLDPLSETERTIYPLPCQQCDYNFCSDCTKKMIAASKDDYEISSDGSRQVKVTVSCPQCRCKYPINDLEETVLLLREIHLLASSILKEKELNHGMTQTKTNLSSGEMILVRDSELTASQLARKSELATRNVRKRLDEAHVLYEKAFENEHANNNAKSDEITKAKTTREEARVLWMTLLNQLPVNDDNFEDVGGGYNSDRIDTVGSGASSVANISITPRKAAVDDTLFQGYDELINRDEKIFLTELYTSGDVQKITQASQIMMGIRRMCGKYTISARKQQEQPMSKYEIQKRLDFIDQTKSAFPLANHMPNNFLIPPYNRRDSFMTLKDKKNWDGSIVPPQRCRIFEHVYGQAYKPRASYDVVLIQAVRGPVGRLGLRKGDIVTHVNDTEWKGSAQILQDYIYQCYSKHPGDEISLTVNANPETAEFLRVRRELMQSKNAKNQNSSNNYARS